VVRVGFDNGQANHSGVGNKSPEQRPDMVQSHASSVRRNVGQRQVESIQNVNIEMYDKMSLREGRCRTSTSGDRISDHLRTSQSGRWHQAVHILLVVAKADVRGPASGLLGIATP
jgi:hypothetical protein